MNLNKGTLTPIQQKVLALVILLFLVSLYYLRTIYIPIFLSYFLAFLLNPLVHYLEKRGFGRVGPIFLLLTLVFLSLGAFLVFMTPKVVVQLQQLVQKAPLLIDYLSERFGPQAVQYLGYDVFTQWKEVLPKVIPDNPAYPAISILENLFLGTAKALSFVLTTLMIPILTFYILKDYYKLNEQLLKLVPRRFLSDVREIFRRLSVVLGGLIRGQFLVCAILAAYYSVALTAVGMEMSLLLGIFCGIMNLIPFVGPLASLALTLFLAILGGAQLSQGIAIFSVFMVANLVDNTVLTPKIVGKQMGISPLTIILALLAGSELLGFLGILLALPIMAMVKVLWGYLTERYLESSYYKEEVQVEGKQTLSDGL